MYYSITKKFILAAPPAERASYYSRFFEPLFYSFWFDNDEIRTRAPCMGNSVANCRLRPLSHVVLMVNEN